MHKAPLGTPQAAGTDLWSSLLAKVQHRHGTLTRRDRNDVDVTLTAAQLVERATAVAMQLISKGANPGDCVMLVVGDPLAFACGFWACQAAGLLAVPMPPMGSDTQKERTLAALAVLDQAWVLTEDHDTLLTLTTSKHTKGAYLLSGPDFDSLKSVAHLNRPLPSVDPDAVSVVMFSSGSTGAPKGVDLTHRAIQSQMELLKTGLSLQNSDKFLNWMPMSHDFGLFHFHILPLLHGVPQLLITPEDFSRRPMSWIKALSDFEATITGAPNLALEIISSVIKPERAAQFNLNKLRVVTLGAEPLVPRVLTTFAQSLVPTGFRSAALQPAYGLAEATLIITMHSGLQTVTVSRHALDPGQKIQLLDKGDSKALCLPMLGKPIKDAEFRIVDDNGIQKDENHVGHLHVRSGAIMSGYRNQPDQTAAVLKSDGWLDTGDIGFIHDGEFVMVGRAKDVIISGGSNFHPSDLERIVQTTPGMPAVAPQVAIAQGRDPETGDQSTLAFFRVRGKKLDLPALCQAITVHLLAQSGIALDKIFGVRDLPRTTSGKIQRHALVHAFENGAFIGQDVIPSTLQSAEGDAMRTALKTGDMRHAASLITTAAEVLSGTTITPNEPLMDQGLSSRQSMALCTKIGGWLGRDISIARLFDHPSPQAFAEYLATGDDSLPLVENTGLIQDPIAIIGYGCRFPGCDTPEEFWSFLNAPTAVVTAIPADRWTQAPPLPPAALLSDIDRFDPSRFGLSQTEAEGMNPMQRLILNVLWQAIEDAGLDIHALAGKRVGLFIGLSETGLATGRAETLPDPDAQAGYVVVGSAGSIAVGRIAHLFDFRGPAMAIDTACSSSLTAMDLAAQALTLGRCDLAIAGGANLILSPDLHAGLTNMGALSPDGLCKTFDASADGYGRAEGAGLVVLKRTKDAQRDADHIAAELIATVVNHDGKSQSVTAPNGRAQRDLIRRALQAGNLAGDDLDWVETHGTGTALGDPIELDAIETVLRRRSGSPLPLGAVKSLIGHLEAAAGVAGVIKVLLAMKHGFVPANRPCTVLNKRFAWEKQTLGAMAEGFRWTKTGRRLAGIASFGMSGTNAYAILSDLAQLEDKTQPSRPTILPLSVLCDTASAQFVAHWSTLLDKSKPDAHNNLAAGQASRRIAGPIRKIAVLHDATEIDLTKSQFIRAFEAPNYVFVYPGQGAQAARMGEDLYRTEPLFKSAFDDASAAAGDVAGRSLVDWLYGDTPADDTRLSQTELAQPALVGFGHALTALWAGFGLQPLATLGHSVGEIGGALASGILSLNDAMSLAVARGRVMQDSAEDGAMLALRATQAQAEALIKDVPAVCIAGFNGPMSLSLSGPKDAIATVFVAAQKADLPCTQIAVTRAFHSPAMQPAADALAAAITLNPKAQSDVRVFSTLTGAQVTAETLTSAHYWQQQMREPVQFAKAVTTAALTPETIFVEMGPSGVLSRLGPSIAPKSAWIAGTNTQATLAESVGAAWTYGAAIDWQSWFGTRGAAGSDLPRHPRTDITIPRRAISAIELVSEMQQIPPTPQIASTDTLPEILAILSRISGVAETIIDPDALLTSLGLDSLAMVQVQRALAKQTALDLELRVLFEGAETPRKLANLLATARPAPSAPMAQQASQSEDIAVLFQAQIKLVEDLIGKQFAVLQGGSVPVPATTPMPSKPANAPAQIKGLFSKSGMSNAHLSKTQKDHISRLTKEWNARSAGSKAGAQLARKHVANSRTVFGYTPETKELTYPLLTDRAEGAYVWDVDGSKYIDITMGFGTCLFGHNAAFIKDAVIEELHKGSALGPATPLAEKVAKRINTLTGAERSAFFSTGTEAIMCAVRIARAVTGRPRIVVFRGAYHGSFDGVLATGWIDPDGTPQSAPMTDGTLQGMIDPVISLNYGDPEALDVIRRYADEIALVLVEPVQSRDPENRPFEFVRELRALTHDHKVPLLLDEIISGFRFSPGGMQELLGIKADLVTYGKVLGHGLPIGVLTGDPRFMDAIDGGMWEYGDVSGPGPRTAFVAGTFNGHPLSLAAADAVLRHIEEDDGALQEQLSARTENLCQRLDALFTDNNIPVHMARYGSLFRFEFSPGTEILNTHLLNNGIFVWEQRNCFLSTAHSDADLDQIVQAAAAGIAALKRDNWFGDAPCSETIPSHIGEIALRRQAGMVQRGHWTDMIVLKLKRNIAPGILSQHWQTICARHPALRACFAPNYTRRIAPNAAGQFETNDIEGLSPLFETALDRWSLDTINAAFAFDRAPICLSHLRHGPDQAIALSASHLAFDGWSFVLIITELYNLINDIPLETVASESAKYATWERNAIPYLLASPPKALNLPTDGANPQTTKPKGARLTDVSLAPLYQKMATKTAQTGVTPLVGFLAAFVALLAEKSHQSEVTVAVPVSGQALSGCYDLVGNLSFLRPVTVRLTPDMTFSQLRAKLHTEILAPGAAPPADAMPQRHAIFNLDGPITLTGGDATLHPVPISGARADLFANLLILDGAVVLDFDWNADRFSNATAQNWNARFITLAQQSINEDPTLGQSLPSLDFAPQPDISNPTQPAHPTRAFTSSEAKLAAIWKSLLGNDIQSPDAHFIEMGGDSLQAVRLSDQINAHYGISLGLEAVFTHAVLADMALAIQKEAARATTTPPLTRPLPDKIPALPQQQQLRLLEDSSDAGPTYHIAVRIDLSDCLSFEIMTAALAQVQARHTVLRTTFDWSEDGLVQIVNPTVSAHLPISSLAQSHTAFDKFAQAPFASDALAWRLGVAQTETGATTLIIVLHHIISDTWSIEVFVRDLIDACQRVTLQASYLEPKERDYPDFALWHAATTEDRSDAIAYWQDTLKDAPKLTALTGDHLRPPVKSFAGARVSRTLSDELFTRLKSSARGLRATPFQIILAALASETAMQLGHNDIVIGTVSAGRGYSEMSDAIGFFANTLPLRLQVDNTQNWRDHITSCTKTLHAATTHDMVGLQEITTATQYAFDQSANPYFEICLTHDDRRGLTQLGAEMGFQFTEMTLPSSQFDISAYVVETGADLTLNVTYSTSIHTEARIETLLDRLVGHIGAICTDVDQAPRHQYEPNELQKRLWFVDRFENGVLYPSAPTYYNMGAEYQCDAALDDQTVSLRLTKLIAASPLLQAGFAANVDVPTFTAGISTPQNCAVINSAAIADFINAPFDLTQPPLIRAAIINDSDTPQIVVAAHHIIADIQGLDQIAETLISGQMPELASQHQVNPIQADDLTYWRDTIGAHPPRLLLPTDRARAAMHVYQQMTVDAFLSKDETARLTKYIQAHDLTLDGFMTSAFCAFLHRLSGQDTVVFGKTLNRGNKAGLQDNLITLQFNVSNGTPTSQMITQIAATSQQSALHGRTDFDVVVRDLKPENDMSRTALFDVLLINDSTPHPARRTPCATGWGKYDLVMAHLPTSQGATHIRLAANAHMLDQSTIDGWVQIICQILRAIPDHDQMPFSCLPLMLQSHVADAIKKAAPALTPTSRQTTLAAFAAQVNARPDAIAIKQGGAQITYSTLQSDVNTLARKLMAQGIKPGDHMAILLPRGQDYVCAMLAAMTAGAVFIPLDLRAPVDRTAMILADAQVLYVIASPASQTSLPHSTHIIDPNAPTQQSNAALPKVNPDDAAYIIFTSGSTGKPKGVVVEHQNLTSLILDQGDPFDIGQGDIWSWFHSAAFDFSIWEVWGALLTGGTLVPVPEEIQSDLTAVRAFLANENVTQLSITPSAFRAISDVEMTMQSANLSVTAIWFGGEALVPNTLTQWSQRYPDCNLFNLFGITETTVHTTFHAVSAADLNRSDSPIGKALPSYGVSLRDPQLCPVPPGVPGEIVVSGTGVARGYLNDPVKSAERFVNDPYAKGKRLYRSGDLGRELSDGTITYLGRDDNQVKLRGYRIELGEVETAFRQLDGINDAAAGLIGDGGSDGILAIWLATETPPDSDALNVHLAATLPAYMLPKQIFLIDAVPLTLNGKTDSAELARMTDRPLKSAMTGMQPRPGLESAIATILCGVLNIPSISRDDSFFALGGHSLMANKAVLRLRKELSLDLSLRDFFITQSVAGLATQTAQTKSTPLVETILRQPKQEKYHLSSAQTRLFAIQNADPNTIAYNVVGGLILEGTPNVGALSAAFCALLERHEILRTRFIEITGEPFQVVDSAPLKFELPILDLTAASEGAKTAQALDFEFAHVFDLAEGPVFRAALGQLGDERWILIINQHHIVSDGWSVPILLGDLSAFYDAQLNARQTDLAPLAIQYRDFACWQAGTHSHKAAVAQASEHLADHWRLADPITAFATDLPRNAKRLGQGGMARHSLGTNASAALRACLNNMGATLFSASAAALHILLRLRGIGDEDASTVIGTADAGRDAIETEDQIGFYLNLLPHAMLMQGEATLEEWLSEAIVETATMLGYKTAPFEQVIDALSLSPASGHTPAFDVLLIVQTNQTPVQQLGPHHATLIPDETRTSRYDLNIMVEDNENIEVQIEYDSALFNIQTVEALLADYLSLLTAIASRPSDTPLMVLDDHRDQVTATHGILDEDDPLLGAL
jgi:amino acid adenylation domain-containing protein